jgi:hypothetical protein
MPILGPGFYSTFLFLPLFLPSHHLLASDCFLLGLSGKDYCDCDYLVPTWKI